MTDKANTVEKKNKLTTIRVNGKAFASLTAFWCYFEICYQYKTNILARLLINIVTASQKPASVMVLECIRAQGRGYLHIYEGAINGE